MSNELKERVRRLIVLHITSSGYTVDEMADAAIALICAEVLEEALTALYSVPRWEDEIFDSLTQTADGSFVYIDEAAAAIRAMKEKP